MQWEGGSGAAAYPRGALPAGCSCRRRRQRRSSQRLRRSWQPPSRCRSSQQAPAPSRSGPSARGPPLLCGRHAAGSGGSAAVAATEQLPCGARWGKVGQRREAGRARAGGGQEAGGRAGSWEWCPALPCLAPAAGGGGRVEPCRHMEHALQRRSQSVVGEAWRLALVDLRCCRLLSVTVLSNAGRAAWAALPAWCTRPGASRPPGPLWKRAAARQRSGCRWTGCTTGRGSAFWALYCLRCPGAVPLQACGGECRTPAYGG